MAQSTAVADAEGSPDVGGDETHVFIGRQPIFNATKSLVVYKLLFRSSPLNSFPQENANSASSQLIDHVAHRFDLKKLVGRQPLMVHVTDDVLSNDEFFLLPQGDTILELSGDMQVTEDLLKDCRRAKSAGYKLAINGALDQAENKSLVKLADYVMIEPEVRDSPMGQKLVELCKSADIYTVAVKVESEQEFEQAKRIGFNYFQGYFFCRPQVIKGRKLPASKQNILRFIQAVNDPEIDFDNLELLVRQEPELSIRLLKWTNSAAVGMRDQVDSIKRALTLLGVIHLRKWASAIAVCCLCDDNKPRELMVTAMVRGRFCETVSEQIGMSGRQFDLFMLGSMSTLDAMLDIVLEDAIKDIPLPSDVKATLLGEQTGLSGIFELALAQERGDFFTLSRLSEQLEIPIDVFSRSFMEATAWSGQVLESA